MALHWHRLFDFVRDKSIKDTNDFLEEAAKAINASQAGNPIKCIVEREAVQPIAHADFDYIQYDAETSDSEDMWAAGDNTKVYCKTAGVFSVDACVGFFANATGHRRLDILHTSGAVTKVITGDSKRAVSSAATLLSASGELTMAVGDYIRVRLFQNSGAPLNIDANSPNRLSVVASMGEKGNEGRRGIQGIPGAAGNITGQLILWSGPDTPSGFLELGSPVSRTTYADLFALIGTSYGAGDGSTTFDLPPAPTIP